MSKVYWPEDGYTKGNLVEYYRQVAPVVVPYLRGRPMSLHRHPDGISAEGFFQKDVGRHPPPPWVRTATVRSSSKKGTVTYVVCDDEPTLLYLANLGCIELNPWNARAETPEFPDWLIVDLDPEAISFAAVIKAAVAVRKVLDRAGVVSVCKTSGKRGLHVCVPLGAKYGLDEARMFAELVASVVLRQLPGSTSLERSPAKRQRRVYLDYLQNRRGQTLAAPYSVRPKGHGLDAPALARGPQGLDPARFTIRTLPRRLATRSATCGARSSAPGADLAAALTHFRNRRVWCGHRPDFRGCPESARISCFQAGPEQVQAVTNRGIGHSGAAGAHSRPRPAPRPQNGHPITAKRNTRCPRTHHRFSRRVGSWSLPSTGSSGQWVDGHGPEDGLPSGPGGWSR